MEDQHQIADGVQGREPRQDRGILSRRGASTSGDPPPRSLLGRAPGIDRNVTNI